MIYGESIPTIKIPYGGCIIRSRNGIKTLEQKQVLGLGISLTHRIHGAGIYANMTGVYWWDPWHTIYSSTEKGSVMGYKQSFMDTVLDSR